MRIFFISIGTVLFIGVIVFISHSGVKEYNRMSAIDREIDGFQEEISNLEMKNSLLEERVEYFSSNEYKEHTAKERLGYRKKGEHVVVMRVQPKKEKKEEMFYEKKYEEKNNGLSETGIVAWLKHFFTKET